MKLKLGVATALSLTLALGTTSALAKCDDGEIACRLPLLDHYNDVHQNQNKQIVFQRKFQRLKLVQRHDHELCRLCDLHRG